MVVQHSTTICRQKNWKGCQKTHQDLLQVQPEPNPEETNHAQLGFFVLVTWGFTVGPAVHLFFFKNSSWKICLKLEKHQDHPKSEFWTPVSCWFEHVSFLFCWLFFPRLVSVFWTGDEVIDALQSQLLERLLKAQPRQHPVAVVSAPQAPGKDTVKRWSKRLWQSGFEDVFIDHHIWDTKVTIDSFSNDLKPPIRYKSSSYAKSLIVVARVRLIRHGKGWQVIAGKRGSSPPDIEMAEMGIWIKIICLTWVFTFTNFEHKLNLHVTAICDHWWPATFSTANFGEIHKWHDMAQAPFYTSIRTQQQLGILALLSLESDEIHSISPYFTMLTCQICIDLSVFQGYIVQSQSDRIGNLARVLLIVQWLSCMANVQPAIVCQQEQRQGSSRSARSGGWLLGVISGSESWDIEFLIAFGNVWMFDCLTWAVLFLKIVGHF